MTLGVSMWSYFPAWRDGRLSIPGFIHEAKRAGADFVELLDFFYRDREADRAEALMALAETGLSVPIFSISNNFAKPDAVDRRAEFDKIRGGVDEAGRFGAGIVRVFAGDVSEGMTFEDARGWIVEGLAEASRYAHDQGVRLALENHGKLAGRGDQVRELVLDVRAKAGNDALGANPDTGNFVLVGQASHEAIRQVAPIAVMVHFKDFIHAADDHTGFAYTSLDGTKFVGTAVGEGEVDLTACVRELKAAGFDGCLSVEYEGLEDPMVAVPRSLENARRYL
jgi:sugar phosphate isomerase/epimerase